MQKLIRRSLAASAISLAALTAASAQEAITLKLAHPLPNTHYAYENGIKKFTDAVTAKSGGKVKFEVYPASQLGKDNYSVVNSGIANIAMIVTSYAPDKFPLTSVTELPTLFSTSCEAMAKYWSLSKPGGILEAREYKPLGLKVLMVSTLPQYSFTTTTKPVKALADVAGLKIFANGAAMDKTVRALGGVPVRLTASELFDAASRGTVDGAVFPYSSLAAYKLEGYIKHSAEGARLGSASWMLAMSEKGWRALPEDVKQAIGDAGLEVQNSLCKYMDDDDGATRRRLESEKGLSVTKLSPDEIKLWHEKLAPVATDWAKEMDSKGKPGTAVIEALRAAGSSQ
ncbi:TRAP transporter substrate-binding protein DctP [Bosea sp. ASV33]|uniref:TRAP transporter substrate-binding protein n=1 Tax=Bosea sp. ASV33 TaxID=2795106 RepID=UPI0018ED7C13|nr:TRAP transporter substrate-binding protein DctP [Bosea sp. ASV33]